MYDTGEGVPQDYKQAIEWYIKAADQGHASSQFNLGNMYANGRGVSQDYTQAVVWYTKSAEQGNASAQYSLGLMYTNGLCSPSLVFRSRCVLADAPPDVISGAVSVGTTSVVKRHSWIDYRNGSRVNCSAVQ